MLPISILLGLTFCTTNVFAQEAVAPSAETEAAALPSTPVAAPPTTTPTTTSNAVPTASPSLATSSSPLAFNQALETFKANHLAESRQHFTELLTQYPNDPVILYNLGLVEFTDKHPGKSLAYWRKALYLQPGFAPALSGIRQVHRVIPNFKSSEPSIWSEIYWRIPLWFFLTASFLFFTVAGALWVLHTARRKKDLPSSALSPIIASFIFAIFFSFALHAYFTYYKTPQGTVLETPLAVRSAPSEDSPSLIEFNEGDEVEILRTQDGWLQVQKSSTAVGWVPQQKVLIHSGF